MRSTHVQKWCIMFLPVCFSAKHLKGVSGFIKLQLSDGKQWPVHCQYGRGGAELESVNRVSFVSSLGRDRCRKCVTYLETTPKHVHDSRSKRCKIEKVVDNSDAVGDVSELRKTANKVVTHSSDGKNKSKYCKLFVLVQLSLGNCSQVFFFFAAISMNCR
ncbi:hypothetical protein Ddye_003769 [Dipteronia dyeriana]|uniref:Uncharacterized protein n=1 Tax=Dipteronia dyeriana TaxID=168575 RepID=A0AAD9XTP3_9ROSI|nr:hypothetical protein Ddye_003769 [Dipteronia dyeriana]